MNAIENTYDLILKNEKCPPRRNCQVEPQWTPLHNEWRIYAPLNEATIGSDNGLSPDRRQAITWTIAELLSIGLLGRNT